MLELMLEKLVVTQRVCLKAKTRKVSSMALVATHFKKHKPLLEVLHA
jgi:hypothetical protein